MSEHFRYQRLTNTLRGYDGSMAEHHTDPCVICNLAELEEALRAARKLREMLAHSPLDPGYYRIRRELKAFDDSVAVLDPKDLKE